MVNQCDSFLDYLNRYNTVNEVIELEKHLSVRQSCRDYIGIFCESLELLQQDYVARNVPGSLKKEVLNFVFDRETE